MPLKVEDKSVHNRPFELSAVDNLLIDMLLSLSPKGRSYFIQYLLRYHQILIIIAVNYTFVGVIISQCSNSII